MLSPLTQISLEQTGVRFVNQTAQGAQLIRVTMLLREPTLLAASVTLKDGSLVFSPMAVTRREIEEFFNAAQQRWEMKGMS